MLVIYDVDIDNSAIQENLKRICNQIFKLLPMREEGQDYIKPTETLIVELLGMAHLLPEVKELFSLVCKLEGLKEGGEEIEFFLYRRTIFECCGIIDQIKRTL